MEEQNNKPRIRLARQVARKLLADVGIKSLPVSMGNIINYLKEGRDLSVYSWNFSDNIGGVHSMENERATIGYNQNQHLHRQRFTIAHEIGHLLLSHTALNFILDLKSNKLEEVEANQFAAELLIPLSFIKSDIKKIKSVKQLAIRYLVSEESMWWRLRELNLIKYLV